MPQLQIGQSKRVEQYHFFVSQGAVGVRTRNETVKCCPGSELQMKGAQWVHSSHEYIASYAQHGAALTISFKFSNTLSLISAHFRTAFTISTIQAPLQQQQAAITATTVVIFKYCC